MALKKSCCLTPFQRSFLIEPRTDSFCVNIYKPIYTIEFVMSDGIARKPGYLKTEA